MTAKDQTTTADDHIARARALAPQIAAAAAQIEEARKLPTDLVAALHEAGLFRMLIPRSIGGAELPPHVFVQAIEEIAKADASTAWCVAQYSGASTLAASLDRDVAREVFAPGVLVGMGPPHASGRAVAVAGGYRVSGQWQFASGSRHADWMAAHCPVFEPDGSARIGANGMPDERTLIFPKRDVTMQDIWHVIGLKGTGSDSYSAADVFVPEQRSMTSFGRNPAEKRESGPLYKFTTFQLHGAGFAAIAIGVARACLDAFVELAKGKTPYGMKYLLRDNAVIQAKVGLAQAQLASARTFLIDALAAMWQGAQSGGFTVDQRLTLRMASTHGTRQAREVVDAIYHAAGASAIFESNPFERRFRDVHTISQQVQAHDTVFEAIGQYYLGLPLHPRLI